MMKYKIDNNIFDPNDCSIKTLCNIGLYGLSSYYDYKYTGMVSNLTNLPHGFGRAIFKNNENFIEGYFQNG